MRRARTLAGTVLAGVLAALLAGCSGYPAAAFGPGPSGAARVTADTPPLPAATVRRLPAGVFYLLAGPAIDSYNAWQISAKGGERRLTRNSSGNGVAEFSASPAGIVLDDPTPFTGGFITPRLVRLTAHGPVPLPRGGNDRSPAVSDTGAVADEIPAGKARPYEVEVRPSFTSAGHVILRARQYVTPSWGPHGSVAAVVSGHPAYLTGPRSRLLVISPSGHVHEIRTGYRLIRDAQWSQHASAFAVADWDNHGQVIWPDGKHRALPAGWQPAAWNPVGTTLLVWRLDNSGGASTLGLWSPRTPRHITAIGATNRADLFGSIAWLPRPAHM